MDIEATLDQLLSWAAIEDNIRAVVLTGSAARGAADQYSDLDIELYVIDSIRLLDHDDWYRQFGRVLVVESLENEGWNPTRLIYYGGGKIDFTILAVSVLRRGVEFDRPFRVLLDKDDMAGAFRAVPLPGAQPPTEAEFLECVNWFYAALIMWSKQVARDDPWAAKMRDRDSKQMSLRMLEWDHKARKGWTYDTWHLGAHLRDWVDPDLLPAITATWCGTDPVESARAIRSSLTLFDALSS
ncbi:MAG TPA: aminoglycoside 6-adenylyltransferase, partial [Chloroflexota bacterium]